MNDRMYRVGCSDSVHHFQTQGAEVLAAAFERTVLTPAFVGQYSFCSEERNPHVQLILEEAKGIHVSEEALLKTRRNCTGQPANDFNKP